MKRDRFWLAKHIGETLTFKFTTPMGTEITSKRPLQYENEKYFFQVGYNYLDAEKCTIL